MTQLLNQGLLMTAIGMGLVFLALIFLWGLINLIARLPIKEKAAGGTPEAEETPAAVADAGAAVEEPRTALRAQAAAAAVATALAMRRTAVRLAPPQGSAISPWQAARRGSQFAMNAHITSRNSRSSAR